MNKPLAKKENLEKLLKLLPPLIKEKGNEWFKAELIKVVAGGESYTRLIGDTLHSYAEVGEQYVIINPNALLIDYEGIPDEKVRMQLIADCFEMARHRLGRVTHKQDFDGYCRYAHLQAEELINYFLAKKYNNEIQNIIIFLEQYSSYRHNPTRIPSDIKLIDYGYKLYAIKESLIFPIDYSTLYSLKEVRNKLSHRSTFTIQTEDNILNKSNQRKTLTDDERKEMLTIKFMRNTDFNTVFLAVENLKNQVISAM